MAIIWRSIGVYSRDTAGFESISGQALVPDFRKRARIANLAPGYWLRVSSYVMSLRRSFIMRFPQVVCKKPTFSIGGLIKPVQTSGSLERLSRVAGLLQVFRYDYFGDSAAGP